MKTLFVILAGIIFAHSSAFSQKLSVNSQSQNDDYFSWSYALGFDGSTNSKKINTQQGYDYLSGVEFSLHASSLNEIFMSYNFQKFSDQQYEPSLSISALSTGPRIHILNDRNTFVECAFAACIVNNLRNYKNPDDYISNDLFLGCSFGLGRDYAINKSTTLNLSAGMTAVFTRPGVLMLYGVKTRFSFNTLNEDEKSKYRKDFPCHWAFTAFGGINNPDFFVNQSFAWGGSYGFEAAFKFSPRSETFFKIAKNHFVRLYSYSGWIESISPYSTPEYNSLEALLGQRFYFNKGPVSSYVNLGCGLYTYHSAYNSDYNDFTASNFGIFIGNGLLIHLYKSLSINIGANANLVFADQLIEGAYMAVTSGIRFDL